MEKKTVLIVDDTMFMRSCIRRILEKNLFQVIGEAEDGTIAVQKYAELKPDFVTMDITMPGMNGIETIKKIKAIDSNAKIVVVSALGQEMMVVRAISAGALSFIVKPIKEEHFIKTIMGI